MMLEGMSVRAISRLTGLHKGTILSLMNTAAERAARMLDSLVRNVRVSYVQADEIGASSARSNAQMRVGDSPELGDQWAFIAMDARNEADCVLRDRQANAETTHRFLADLQEPDCRCQVPT